MAVDIFLICFIVIWVVLALGINIKLLFYYMQPGDRNFTKSVYVKSVVVLALAIAWMLVMMLPLDVRNGQARADTYKLDMGLLWMILFGLVTFFLVVVIPGTIFYYEVEDDDTNKSKFTSVICQWTISIAVALVVIVVFFLTCRNATIPIDKYECDPGVACEAGEPSTITVPVGIEVFIIGLVCFVGWFVFVTFGGIGLTALPLSYIFAYIDRPIPIDLPTYTEKKQMYGTTASALLEQADKLAQRDRELQEKTGFAAERKKRDLKNDFNKFKQTAYLLEMEFEKIEVSMKLRGQNPLVSIAVLVLGILFAIVSVLWWLHVILFVLLDRFASMPISFLNDILCAIQGNDPGTAGPNFMIAVIVFSFLNVHLLLCVIQGCVKVGMKIFCLPIHPMRAGNTPLNSFLFNVIVILFAASAITQFSQNALKEYSRSSSAANIFQAQIRYLSFFRFFNDYEIFSIMFVAWAVLSLIFLMCKPRDMPALNLDSKAEKSFKKAMGTVKKEAAKAAMGMS